MAERSAGTLSPLRPLVPRLVALVAGAGLAVAAGAIASVAQDAPDPAWPGVVSTRAVEHGAALSPDGRTLWFTRSPGPWGADTPSTIHVAEQTDTDWTDPVPAPFSAGHSDSDPFVTPDGGTLYFTSDRPAPAGRGGGQDIWAYRLSDGAGERLRFVEGVNSPADEYSPVVTSSGRLYFASARTGGLGQGDLYAAPPADDGFGTPRNLGHPVNAPFGEWNLTVDPDERFLIFEASGRATNHTGPGDLYASFRDGENWSPSVALDAVNTRGSDLMPRLSPGGDTLYFASSRSLDGTHTDVYAVGLDAILEEARAAPREVLLAVSRSAHHVAIIDPQTLQIVGRIDTGAGPHEVAALAAGRAVVADYGNFPVPHDEPVDAHPGFAEHPTGNTVTVLDLDAGAAHGTIGLPECARAHGIVAAGDGTTAWATCQEERVVVEIDIPGERVARRFDTGQAGSHRLVATHGDRYLTVANTESGSVSIIDRSDGTHRVVETGAGSEGLAVAPDGTVWVLASGDRTITRVDVERAEILESFETGGVFPISVALDPASGNAWIAHMGPRSVDVLDLETGERVDRIQFDTGPLRVLAPPESRHAYVSLPRENAVAVVDRATRAVIGHVRGIMEVDGLVWTRLGSP